MLELKIEKEEKWRVKMSNRKPKRNNINLKNYKLKTQVDKFTWIIREGKSIFKAVLRPTKGFIKQKM